MPRPSGTLLAVLRRSWLVALAIVVSIGIALLLTARQEPRFAARATWVVTPVASITDPADVLRSLETLERRTLVATFARLAATAPVRSELEERLELDDQGLRGYDLRGTVVPYTNLIRFEAEGPDSGLTAAAANRLARQIRNEAGSLYPLYTLREVEPARASGRPVSPDPGRNAVVAALIGLFVGLAAVTLPVLWSVSAEKGVPVGDDRRPAPETRGA